MAELRERILSGEWPVGTQLPTRSELSRRYRASMATVQRALDGLRADGFVRPRGRLGTLVEDAAPQRRRIGICFAGEPRAGRAWSRMCSVFEAEAERLVRGEGRDFRIYYGLQGTDSRGYHDLVADLEAERLAGVFFAGINLDHLHGTPVLTQPRVRRAALSSSPTPFSRVEFRPYLADAIRYLRERGRRRLTLVLPSNLVSLETRWDALKAEYSLPRDLVDFIACEPHHSPSNRAIGQLLWRQAPGLRPDGLIVLDDHLVDPVTAGLASAGARVPDELEILAHCNLPQVPPAQLPVTYVGFHLGEVLEQVAELLAPLTGEPAPLPELMTFEARFGVAKSSGGSRRPPTDGESAPQGVELARLFG